MATVAIRKPVRVTRLRPALSSPRRRRVFRQECCYVRLKDIHRCACLLIFRRGHERRRDKFLRPRRVGKPNARAGRTLAVALSLGKLVLKIGEMKTRRDNTPKIYGLY